MDLKIRVFLLLTVLGIAVHYGQAGKKLCDWPLGTCTYIYDPCPPYWERCPQYDGDCPVTTNHCCCRRKTHPPVDGGYSPWGPYGPCSKSCGGGIQTRTRTCTNPPPSYGGRDCSRLGPASQARRCNPYPCPGRNLCDWPRGTCTYIYDPCPPDWERCPQYDSYCKLPTNHCCCRKKVPIKKVADVKVQDTAAPCDWPYGTCTYIPECPPNWVHCPSRDSGCSLPTNHCCCRTTPTPPPGRCDYPRGFCTFVNDTCPPNMERCSDYDIDCKLRTNHCCCHKKSTSVRDFAVTCDYPQGTCAYKEDDCPPGWKACPEMDSGCEKPTNKCCCRET